MTREGNGYKEVVHSNGGMGGPRHIREEMAADQGYVRRRGLALGREAGGRIKVRSLQLRTVGRSIEHFLSGRCSVIVCPGKPGGVVDVKVTKH